MASDAPLLALLAAERRALLAADWPTLAALAPAKARAVAILEAPVEAPGAVPGAPPGAPAVSATVRRGLLRNQALLLAALEGVREAARRRLASREARRCPTYDAGGGRAALPAPPRVERRA